MFRPRHNQKDFFAVDVGHDTCGIVCIFPPSIRPTMPVSRTYALFTDIASCYRRYPASAEAVAIASTLATDISNTTVATETTTDKRAVVGHYACP
jgi:hypothetical protein